MTTDGAEKVVLDRDELTRAIVRMAHEIVERAAHAGPDAELALVGIPRRGLPALLIRRGAERILIDCGEGTQRQLLQGGGLSDVTDMFITHLHVDHWLGLPGLLQTFSLRDRERPLQVHGPPGLADLMRLMRRVHGRLSFPLEVIELEAGESVRRDTFEIQAVNVRHRVLAYGYVLAEDSRPGRFDAALAEALGVRPGPDFGRLQRGETVAGVHPEQVIGPEREGRKVVVSGDTAPDEQGGQPAPRARHRTGGAGEHHRKVHRGRG